MTNVSNKKKLRIMAGDTEIIIIATPAKHQRLSDVFYHLGTSSICTGTFQPTRGEFSNFTNEATDILYP